MSAACINCRFFHLKGPETKQFSDVDGMCRRNSPRGFTAVASGLLFPPMNSAQWCGDHEPAPVAAKSEALAAQPHPKPDRSAV